MDAGTGAPASDSSAGRARRPVGRRGGCWRGGSGTRTGTGDTRRERELRTNAQSIKENESFAKLEKLLRNRRWFVPREARSGGKEREQQMEERVANPPLNAAPRPTSQSSKRTSRRRKGKQAGRRAGGSILFRVTHEPDSEEELRAERKTCSSDRRACWLHALLCFNRVQAQPARD